MPDDAHTWRFARPGDRKVARAVIDLHVVLKHDVLSVSAKESIRAEMARLMTQQGFASMSLVRAAARSSATRSPRPAHSCCCSSPWRASSGAAPMANTRPNEVYLPNTRKTPAVQPFETERVRDLDDVDDRRDRRRRRQEGRALRQETDPLAELGLSTPFRPRSQPR
jgi:hypothetical protein